MLSYLKIYAPAHTGQRHSVLELQKPDHCIFCSCYPPVSRGAKPALIWRMQAVPAGPSKLLQCLHRLRRDLHKELDDVDGLLTCLDVVFAV